MPNPPEPRMIESASAPGGALAARAYPSDDYPGLASLATGSTRASHVQLVLEASKALDEIAGLREDLARLQARHDGLIQRLSG